MKYLLYNNERVPVRNLKINLRTFEADFKIDRKPGFHLQNFLNLLEGQQLTQRKGDSFITFSISHARCVESNSIKTYGNIDVSFEWTGEETKIIFILPKLPKIFHSGTTSMAMGWTSDHTPLLLGNKCWILRKGYQNSRKQIVPLDTLHEIPNEKFWKATILETSISKNKEEFELACNTANILSNLLSIALGKVLRWKYAYFLHNGQLQVCKAENNIDAVTHDVQYLIPVDNHSLKLFLQNAYAPYRQNKTWWDITAHWFALAMETKNIENESLLYCMLLDRIGTLIYPHIFPHKYQINRATHDILSSEQLKKELIQNLHSTLATAIDGWPETRTEILLGTISGWNKLPGYKSKIISIFEKCGYDSNQINQKYLNKRHPLVHDGTMFYETSYDSLKFRGDMKKYTSLLILGMLDYSGEFTCQKEISPKHFAYKPLKVDQELPDYKYLVINQ